MKPEKLVNILKRFYSSSKQLACRLMKPVAYFYNSLEFRDRLIVILITCFVLACIIIFLGIDLIIVFLVLSLITIALFITNKFVQGLEKQQKRRHREAIRDYDDVIEAYRYIYPLLSILNLILRLNPKTNLSISTNKDNEAHPSGMISEKEYPYIYKLAEYMLRNTNIFTDAYNNRGSSKATLGKHEEAIADFEKAIELDPKFALAHYNRGNSKAILGKHEEAIADCDKAIELNSEFVFAYYNRGNSKAILGKHEEAIADYDRAIELNPKFVFAYYNRGNDKATLGKHEEAIADYGTVIELNPKFAAAYNNRGLEKAILGKHEEAILDYDEAIELGLKIAGVYYNRGNSKASLGKYEEAISDYDRAIELNPANANSYKEIRQEVQRKLDASQSST